MRYIGDSIQEAIDWTQDQLATSRPLAERTLFLMLLDKKAQETEHGFVITEDAEELHKRHSTITHSKRGGYRFNRMRKHAKKIHKESHIFVQKLDHMRKLQLHQRLKNMMRDIMDPDVSTEYDVLFENKP